MPDFSLFLILHLSIVQILENFKKNLKMNERFNTKRLKFLKIVRVWGAGLKGAAAGHVMLITLIIR